MDIANYLSDLLSQHGEINVPGLGYFVRLRVDGYYNDTEGILYPPGFKIEFAPQTIDDDDVLTKHIAENKKISLASSKYFTEKYISGLKSEAALQDVEFADLGWFYTDKGQIAFRPREKHGENSTFFGYQPVRIRKYTGIPTEVVTIKETVVHLTPPPPLPLPTPPPLPSSLPFQPQNAEEEQEEYVEYEPEEKRGVSVWVIVLLVVIALAAAIFGLYQYKPGLFNFNDSQEDVQLPIVPKTQSALKPDSDTTKVKTQTLDTPAKAISKPDSTLNKPQAATIQTDTVAKSVYVVFISSFKTTKAAERELVKYKKAGIDARIWSGQGTGKLIKIIDGNFATFAEAEAERTKLVTSKKIGKDSYSRLLINTKK